MFLFQALKPHAFNNAFNLRHPTLSPQPSATWWPLPTAAAGTGPAPDADGADAERSATCARIHIHAASSVGKAATCNAGGNGPSATKSSPRATSSFGNTRRAITEA